MPVPMNIGRRLRQLRHAKPLSQNELKQRTGLTRALISRIENGHTIPSIETLELLAAGLEIPLYRFFYAGKKAPRMVLPGTVEAGHARKRIGRRYLLKLRRAIARIAKSDRALLLCLCKKLAQG